MRRTVSYLGLFLIAVVGIVFYGCSNSPTSNAPITPVSNPDTHDEHDEHDHDSANSGGDAMAKMEKGLANLSEADRASAMKQHVCPVSGEMLGTMGEPIKVTVKDQEFWICCNGCKDDLLANPDEFLAKIKK